MSKDTLFLVSVDTIVAKEITEKHFIGINPKGNTEGSFLGINKDYATLILIPILSFLLALLFSFIRTKLKIKAKLRLDQDFLFTWVDLIAPQISKQKQSLYDFSKTLLLDGTQIGSFKRIDLHIEKFRLIQSSELIQLFVINREAKEDKKNELLFNWENNISHIERKVKNIEDHFENFKHFYKTTLAEWNETMVKFNDAYTVFMQSEISHDSTTTDINVGNINNLYKAWHDGKNFSPKNTNESFLYRLVSHQPKSSYSA